MEMETSVMDAITQDPLKPVILASAGYDHTIRFWDALSGQCQRILQHPESQVNALTITRDKRFIAAAGNPNIKLFDCLVDRRSDPVHVFEGHKTNVTAVGFQRDNRWLFSASEDETLKVWDMRSAHCQRTLRKPTSSPISTAVLHPNQAEILYGNNGGFISAWDLSNNSCPFEIPPSNNTFGPADPIQSISISLDGLLLAATTRNGFVSVWETSALYAGKLEPKFKFRAHQQAVTKILISPDSQLIATASADHTVKLWKLETTTKSYTTTLDSSLEHDNVESTALELSGSFIGHQKWVWDVSFSADSAYLLSASSDSTCRLWDCSSKETVRHYVGHDKAVTSIALHDISIT